MNEEFSLGVNQKKGAAAGVIGSAVIVLTPLLDQHTGLGPVVSGAVVSWVLGSLRNLLKQKLPRAFGWL